MSDRQEDDSQQTRQSQAQPRDVNCESNESQEVGDAKRVLRKRKVDLNRLASSISCPMVCKFQHCGVQLADYAALEWHYEGHYSKELERLKHVRVKKLPADFPDRHTRRSVRNSAVDRIMRRRSLRQCRIAMNSTASTTPPSTPTDLVCPSCNLAVPSSTSNEGATPKEYSDHVEECLATRTLTNSHLENFETDDDDDVDVDSVFSLETYTWAGQERVRATSLVEGGLRGPGFVSITRGDESEELNILDVDDDEDLDSSHSEQYKETDLIFPKSEESDTDVEENSPLFLEENSNDEEIKDDLAIQIDHSNSHSNVEDFIGESSVSKDSPTDSSEIIIKELREENSRLRETSMCNICMDSYNTPLVSKKCWHVSCEECWMRALGAKKLCPQCKIIIQPKDLRRIYL